MIKIGNSALLAKQYFTVMAGFYKKWKLINHSKENFFLKPTPIFYHTLALLKRKCVLKRMKEHNMDVFNVNCLKVIRGLHYIETQLKMKMMKNISPTSSINCLFCIKSWIYVYIYHNHICNFKQLKVLLYEMHQNHSMPILREINKFQVNPKKVFM